MNNVSVCAFKTSPFVPAPRAHMFQHVCAWCRYKRGRFERTHGDVLSGHTGFFQCATTQHRTTQNNTQQHTETETDRDRGRRQRKKTGTERESKTEEESQDKRRGDEREEDKTTEEIHFQCGGAWPFLVGGVNRLVNFVDDRDLSLLYCVKYDSYLITGFIVQSAHYRIR